MRQAAVPKPARGSAVVTLRNDIALLPASANLGFEHFDHHRCPVQFANARDPVDLYAHFEGAANHDRRSDHDSIELGLGIESAVENRVVLLKVGDRTEVAFRQQIVDFYKSRIMPLENSANACILSLRNASHADLLTRQRSKRPYDLLLLPGCALVLLNECFDIVGLCDRASRRLDSDFLLLSQRCRVKHGVEDIFAPSKLLYVTSRESMCAS